MSNPIYVVDAFTNRKFGGNPAAVCILEEAQDAAWMQSVATEMNLSETAFVYPKNGVHHLRWFAPAAEVALCGHATLATAHILWTTNRLSSDRPAEFDTLSGRLTATRFGDWIILDFPALLAEEFPAPNELLEAVGVAPTFVGRSRLDFLIEVATEDEVRAAKPNFAAIAKIANVRGVIVTSRSDSLDFDFVSRFFCPSVGVNEDPATGSSHCTLGPYWSAKLNRNKLVGHQLSRREGVIKTDGVGERVDLWGQAVTVTEGCLL